MLLIFVLGLVQACSHHQVDAAKVTQQSDIGFLMKSPSGIVLTEGDIETTLLAAPTDATHNVLGNGDNFFKFVSGQYVRKQLIDYAITEKLDQDPKFLAALQDYRDRLLANQAVEHYIALQTKPDFTDLARERYLINQSKYISPKQLRLSHILIRSGKKHSDSEALEIATRVWSKVKQGQDFSALASEYSEDLSADKGGDLGWVKKGQMVKPFERAAFQLQQPGDSSEVIKTRFGYHIIKLIDKKPERQLAFGEVKSKIIQDLEAEHKKELQSQLLLRYDVSDQTEIRKDAITQLYVRLKKNLHAR